MRILAWLLALPVALLVIVFAVANRHDLRLELWPLPWSMDLPVYLAVLGALLKGIVIGLVIAWFAGHTARRRAREQKRRADGLERQLEQLRREITARQLEQPRGEAKVKAEAATAMLPAPPDQAG